MCSIQVLSNATVVTVDEESAACRVFDAVVIDGDRIAWVGSAADLPAAWADTPTRDLGGALGHAGPRRLPNPAHHYSGNMLA